MRLGQVRYNVGNKAGKPATVVRADDNDHVVRDVAPARVTMPVNIGRNPSIEKDPKVIDVVNVGGNVPDVANKPLIDQHEVIDITNRPLIEGDVMIDITDKSLTDGHDVIDITSSQEDQRDGERNFAQQVILDIPDVQNEIVLDQEDNRHVMIPAGHGVPKNQNPIPGHVVRIDPDLDPLEYYVVRRDPKPVQPDRPRNPAGVPGEDRANPQRNPLANIPAPAPVPPQPPKVKTLEERMQDMEKEVVGNLSGTSKFK